MAHLTVKNTYLLTLTGDEFYLVSAGLTGNLTEKNKQAAADLNTRILRARENCANEHAYKAARASQLAMQPEDSTCPPPLSTKPPS